MSENNNKNKSADDSRLDQINTDQATSFFFFP